MLGESSWDWTGGDSSVQVQEPELRTQAPPRLGLWPSPPWPVSRGGTAPPQEKQLPKSGWSGTGPTWAVARWSHSQPKNNWAQSGIFLPFSFSFNLLLRRKSLLNAGVFLTPLLTLPFLTESRPPPPSLRHAAGSGKNLMTLFCFHCTYFYGYLLFMAWDTGFPFMEGSKVPFWNEYIYVFKWGFI